MTEQQPSPGNQRLGEDNVPPTAVEPARGLGRDLIDLFIAPREAFGSLLAQPRWWIPFVALLVFNLAGLALWIQKVNPTEFVKAQWEEYGIEDRIPADKRAEMLEDSAAKFNRNAILSGVIGTPLGCVVIALVYLFVFRFFMGSEVRFAQALVIVCWALLAVSLVQKPLGLTTLALKGDWNAPPDDALRANATLLLDRDSVPRPLWSLAGSLDLFSFWTIFLLATGFAVASRTKTGGAVIGAVIPWAIYVLGKVGISALFSMGR